jgi:membrane-bound lytic murein transglycosylase D
MAKNPGDYGLQNIDSDPALEYDTIHVAAKTNLNLIADATMEPVSAIRDLNPAVLGASAPEGYDIHVPKGSGDSTMAALEMVPAANRAAWRLHHVTANDTLETIAKAYNTAPERIMAVNSPQVVSLVEGDTLLIPAEFREERAASSHAPVSHSKSRAHVSSSARLTARPGTTHPSSVHGAVHGVTHVAASAHVTASKRVPAQLLERKAAVHTASVR